MISIDGHWGTGKTFLLKRWQKDLENKGFRVIYFNAWEDDFCDDPLLSIIGQLSEYFEEGKLKSFAEEAARIAVPLLVKNVSSVTNRFTGLTLDVNHNGRDLLREYREQRKTKTDLKEKLAKMSNAVIEETERPLVFIIDELDRCRPTFAIELLERVKHIFDVSGLVFVLGVNRAEICKSLQSIYGEIEADVYLRRFFDMEFSLPSTNASQFCRNLMAKYRLGECFRSLSKAANNNMHSEEFHNLSEAFPALCVCFDLSLRDIDYCVRLIALTARSLSERQYMFPYLLGLLIPLKLKNPVLYRQFILGERRASEVMNYVEEFNTRQTADPHLDEWFTFMEAYLYMSEKPNPALVGGSSPLAQLRRQRQDIDLTHPELLSNRTKALDSERTDWLIGMIDSEKGHRLQMGALNHLAGLIDLHQSLSR